MGIKTYKVTLVNKNQNFLKKIESFIFKLFSNKQVKAIEDIKFINKGKEYNHIIKYIGKDFKYGNLLGLTEENNTLYYVFVKSDILTYIHCLNDITTDIE